jgi:hypothetical protein
LNGLDSLWLDPHVSVLSELAFIQFDCSFESDGHVPGVLLEPERFLFDLIVYPVVPHSHRVPEQRVEHEVARRDANANLLTDRVWTWARGQASPYSVIASLIRPGALPGLL